MTLCCANAGAILTLVRLDKMNAPLVPVVLFAYARPNHLHLTLASLRDNGVPLIYAFSDGPRTPDKTLLVNEVRAMLRAIDWCEVVLLEREENMGLGRSIMAGVTDVLNTHESCLVFEDDLICVPGTYKYLVEALHHYSIDPRVMSVTGWTHPRITPPDVGDRPYFDGRSECLVWGTWARAWQGMNDRTAHEMMLAAEAHGTDRNTYGGDLPGMAEQEIERNIWAVRMLYHHIVKHGLCLRPPWSMVEHIGFDAMATNASATGGWHNPPLRPCPPLPVKWPEPLENPSCAMLQRAAFPPPTSAVLQRTLKRIIGSVARQFRRAAVFISRSRELETITPRQLIGLCLPPIAQHGYHALQCNLRRWFGIASSEKASAILGLTGNYSTWAEAQANSAGYDAENILQKTANALRKVKRGEAVYERDSVLFDEVHYTWPVLAGLMWVASQRGGRINVLDFGGSLGSTYFQNRVFLDSIRDVRWNIVEQLSHVLVGKQEFEDERLRFFDSIESCVAESQPDVILLSSVLQYVEHPYGILEALRDSGATFLIIDRTPYWTGFSDRLCVQSVPAEIYSASYPSWIFSLPRFRSILSLHWDVISEFDAPDKLPGPILLSYRGLIATLRSTGNDA